MISKFLLALLVGTGLTSLAATSEKLTLTGSSTVAPLMAEIAKRFEAKNPGVRVDVQTGGSSRGITDARTGLADVGMVSRSLKTDEADLKSFTVAKDGIGIILHKENPLGQLTKDQVIDIYTGKIKNWKSVGGNDRPITVVSKAEGRSTLELFLSYFGLKSSDLKPHTIIGDNEQGIKVVSGNKDAIGYVSIGAADYNIKLSVPIKVLPMGGVEGSLATIENGSFPLSRPLNLVTKDAPTGVRKKLIEFALSKEVDDIIRAQYFVPIPH